MFADERKSKIMELILRQGNVRISELAREFNVSVETIRRDLNELGKENKIHKVHGGAIAKRHPIREEQYETRINQNPESKKKIAQYAANLISDGDIIALDYGVTMEEIARALYHIKQITVITHSLKEAVILAEKQRQGDFTGKIIFLGGTVDCENFRTSGEIMLSELKRFRADKAFISATSISQNGIMMWDENEGAFSACLCHNSSENYVVADSTKFNKESFYKFLDFDQVGHIITDDENEISEQTKSEINIAGVKLHVLHVTQK